MNFPAGFTSLPLQHKHWFHLITNCKNCTQFCLDIVSHIILNPQSPGRDSIGFMDLKHAVIASGDYIGLKNSVVPLKWYCV